jgi:hypothetical protein
MADEREEFPTGLFLLVALIVLLGVVAIGTIFVTAGIGGMIFAALVAIVVGVPLAIRKSRRPADNPQSVEEEIERERAEAQSEPEHRAAPPR